MAAGRLRQYPQSALPRPPTPPPTRAPEGVEGPGQQGQMPIRLNSFVVVDAGQGVHGSRRLLQGDGEEVLHRTPPVPGVKMFMDGVIEYPAQTAALIDPYLEKVGDEWVPGSNRGDIYFTQKQANRFVTRFDRMNRRIHVHAIGDRAAKVALNAAAAARKANRSARRDNIAIAHLQLVDRPITDASQSRCLRRHAAAGAVSDFGPKTPLHPFIGDERLQPPLTPPAAWSRQGRRSRWARLAG